MQVLTRLRANIFDREGAVSAFLPVLPYLPVDGSDGLNYDGRDSKRHGRGHSFSSGYGGSSDLGAGDGYGSYNGSQVLSRSINGYGNNVIVINAAFSIFISDPAIPILFYLCVAWWWQCLWCLWKLFFGAAWSFWVT